MMNDSEFAEWIKVQEIGFLAMLYAFYKSSPVVTYAVQPISEAEIKTFDKFIQKAKHVS